MKYTRTLTEADFTFKNGNLTTDFVDVYEFKLPAGQKAVLGAGRVVNGVDDREDFHISLSDGTNAIASYEVKIVKRDANNITNIQLYRNLDADGDGQINDKIGEGGATGLEKIDPSKVVLEDQYFVVQIRLLSGSATVSSAASKIRVPITVKALR